MKFKHFVLLNSLVVFLFGAAFIVRPLDMMALYGVIQSGWGVTGCWQRHSSASAWC